MIPLTRREVLAGALATIATPPASAAAPALDGAPLRARAAAKGLLFGAAVQQNQIANDAAYAAAVLREAAIVTPEFELKWATVRPSPGALRTAEPDALLAWCARHGVAMRGHALVWHEALPAWVPRFLDGPAARTLLTDHIAKLAGRYAGRLHSWDVVNEAIEPKHGRADGLRVSVWQAALGADYIELAYRAAAQADPAARLYYNEYGLDVDTRDDDARRRATLALLERLRARDVPLHGLGIQGHLFGAGRRFDAAKFNRFLDAVAALGLEIMITELDVTDDKLPADVATRDATIAAIAADYLAVACAHKAVVGVMSWGLTDRQTWLNDSVDYKRADGLKQRPLPLDDKLGRKPLWGAIAQALDGAPTRAR